MSQGTLLVSVSLLGLIRLQLHYSLSFVRRSSVKNDCLLWALPRRLFSCMYQSDYCSTRMQQWRHCAEFTYSIMMQTYCYCAVDTRSQANRVYLCSQDRYVSDIIVSPHMHEHDTHHSQTYQASASVLLRHCELSFVVDGDCAQRWSIPRFS